MPRVWNTRNKDWPAGAVYIGRRARGWPQSKWANPFVLDHDGTREECIELFEQWPCGNPKGQALLRDISELRGKDLLCWWRRFPVTATYCCGWLTPERELC